MRLPGGDVDVMPGAAVESARIGERATLRVRGRRAEEADTRSRMGDSATLRVVDAVTSIHTVYLHVHVCAKIEVKRNAIA